MAFSSTDRANVEAALVALATGTRVVQVSIGGKNIRYSEADIKELQDLLALIKQDSSTIIPRAYAKNMKRATL